MNKIETTKENKVVIPYVKCPFCGIDCFIMAADSWFRNKGWVRVECSDYKRCKKKFFVWRIKNRYVADVTRN